MKDHEAWDYFRKMMESAERKQADGFVPVCVILGSSMPSDGDFMDVDMSRLCVLWPRDISLEDRRAVLGNALRSYDDPDKIQRFTGTIEDGS